MAQSAFPSYFERDQTRLASWLEGMVPADDASPETVHRAMRSTPMAPSKRVRGILSRLSAELVGQEQRAGAIELVHAPSLILDDLPSRWPRRMRHDTTGGPAEPGRSMDDDMRDKLRSLGYVR